MRPTDENQAGSTRPNLMSSRRAVGEDNILAMLERDSARRTSGRISSLRVAWYGTAAAFAGILAGGVAWLAYDNHKSAAQLQGEYQATAAAVPPVPAGAGTPLQPPSTMLPVPAGELPRAAVIVDESPPAPRTASTVPPLVMLPRQEAAPARPAVTPAARAPKASASAASAKPRTAQLNSRAGSEKKTEKAGKVEKALRAGARAVKPVPARNTVKTAAEPARHRKPASAAPQIDSDVALISAIISQSERHRSAREAAQACKGAACPSKPAQR